MKRSSSQETPHAHGNDVSRKSKTLSSGIRELFRARGKPKSPYFFSSSTSLNAQTETERVKRFNPRLCKSVSTFFIKCCHGCCSCCGCCCVNSATTDSPPRHDEKHDRSRRCWCCYRETRLIGGRVSTSEPPKSSPPPPTALPSIRVRFEEQVHEAEDIDRDLRRRERRIRFKDVAKEECSGSSMGTALTAEQKRKEPIIEQAEEDLSESSSASIKFGPIKNLMMEHSPKLECSQLVHNVLPSLDLPVQITSIPQSESTTGWYLAIIPDNPPPLTVIPPYFLETSVISDIKQSYQSELLSLDDLTPITMRPCAVESMPGGFSNLLALANSRPGIQIVDAEMSEDKNCHFSSSSSSQTSDTCFLSAEEDNSLTEDLFYDPMRIELLDTFDQSLETPLRLADEELTGIGVEPGIQPVPRLQEVNTNEKLMLFTATDEPENIVSLDEQHHSEASETVSGLDRSSESLFMAENATRSESSQRPSVRFNENQEVFLFGDEYSDGEPFDDESVIEEEILEYSVPDVDTPFLQTGNLKLSTEQMGEDHVKASTEFDQKFNGTLQSSDIQSGLLIDSNRVKEAEQEKGALSENSTEFEKYDASLKCGGTSRTDVVERSEHDEDPESRKASTKAIYPTVISALIDNQHKAVFGYDETLKEDQIEEALVSTDKQFNLKSQQNNTITSVSSETAQIHVSPLESTEDATIEPEHPDFTVQTKALRHFQIQDDAKYYLASQMQTAALRDNLEPKQAQGNQLESAEKIVSVLVPSAELFVLSESDIKSTDEEIQGDLESSIGNDDSVYQSHSAVQSLNMRSENANESLPDSVQELEDSIVNLAMQMEPLRDKVLAGESESATIFLATLKSIEASLLADEWNQAVPSEKTSVFDELNDLEQILVKESDNVAGDFSLLLKDVEDQAPVNIKQNTYSTDSTDLRVPYIAHKRIENYHKSVPESCKGVMMNAETDVKVVIQREPMHEQVRIGESESVLYDDRKVATHKADKPLEEGWQVGTSETCALFDMNYEVISFMESKLKDAIKATKVCEDVKTMSPHSDLKLTDNDSTLLDNQEAESSGVSPEFNGEITEKKFEDITESWLKNQTHWPFGTEQSKETALDTTEDLGLKEALGEKFHLETQPLFNKVITEGIVSVPQFNDLFHVGTILSIDEMNQAGATEVTVSFSEDSIVALFVEHVDDNLTTAMQATALDMKSSEDEGISALITAEMMTVLEAKILNDDNSKIKHAEAKLGLQIPIFPVETDLEDAEDLDIADDAAVVLQPKIHPVKQYLPQMTEFYTLEQPFDIHEKNTDFEGDILNAKRQSIDDKLITLSAEIAIADDSKSESDQCEVQQLFKEVPLDDMSGVRRHSIQLRRLSIHFPLNIDDFDTSKSLFDTWLEKNKSERGRYYASFGVEAFRRRETSPDLISVEEDEIVERLDGDNPDRWLVEAAAPDRFGRLATVCLLEKPVASHYRLSTGKNPREQFREEVLTISNKLQECLMKRRHALTDLAEEEEGYQLRIKMVRSILERLDGTQLIDGKKVPLPKEMIAATKGMLSHIDKIVELSESLLNKFQACIMDPPQCATCFTQNKSKWAEYSAYLYLLNQWMQAFKKLISDDKPNNSFCLTPENDEEEGRIDAQHLLEYLFAPKTHISAYEHLLSCLSRYSNRANQDTRSLEEALTALRRIQRRTNEALRLWPYVSNMPNDGSLGVLPSKDGDFLANHLPEPITRMTALKVNIRKGEEKLPDNTQEGFLILEQNGLIFMEKSLIQQKKWEILWQLPLENARLRVDGEGIGPQDFEIWDISNPNEPLKSVYTVTPPNPTSQLAWIQDIQRALSDKNVVDSIVDEALVQTHRKTDEELNPKRVSIAEDGTTDSFYDVDELSKSQSYECDVAAQLDKGGDEESSLTYYTAEGSIMQIHKQGTPKQRPDSILSIDSVNTLDGVSNPFMEQIPEQRDGATETSHIVLTQSISAENPFVHQSKVQAINSSEGGEMELTIETSTSDSEAYTVEWTFGETPLDSEKMGAYPRIEGNTVYLFVPKVTREIHEGSYQCILSWPSGMKAIFPFIVTVHEPDDVEPTNEINKLKLKTTEISKLTVANEDQEGLIEYQEIETIPMAKDQSRGELSSESLKIKLLESDETASRHRASKSSVITNKHEPEVNEDSRNQLRDAFVAEETLSPSEIPQILDDAPKSTQPLVQEYMVPIKLNVVEGEAFKIIASGSVNSSATVSWTHNGRKLPMNVFKIQKNPSTVELTKLRFVESDSGEYTLWVDGKAKGNFLLTVEKMKEEPKGIERNDEPGYQNQPPQEDVKEEVAENLEKIAEVEAAKSSPKESKESLPKEEKDRLVTSQANMIQLSEGENFKLNTNIPLDARQVKSNRLWWTKNGKPFVDVDGVAPRSAKFVSKSSNKSTKSTEVNLVKKEPVSLEDAATYILMGEPRIKRGFRNQETIYATVAVSVVEKPKGDLAQLDKEAELLTVLEKEELIKPEPIKENFELENFSEEPHVDELKVKRSPDKTVEEKLEKKKSLVKDGEQKRRKKSTHGGAEDKPKKKKAVDDNDKEKPMKKSQEGGTKERLEEERPAREEVEEVLKEVVGNIQRDEVSKEEAEKRPSPDERKSVKKEESPKDGIPSALTVVENLIKLKEGEKFELKTNVPLDVWQMKSDRLWWTKDGKSLVDVGGIPVAGTKFNSKSTSKTPKSVDIDLFKSDPTTTEDAATYRLMGEPRIKRGFKSQTTTYVTFIVSVVEQQVDGTTNTPEADNKLKPKETDKQEIEREVDKKWPKEEVIGKVDEKVERKAAINVEDEAKKNESGNMVNLTEGDKFQLNVEIPLDSGQLRSNKLWWMKDGKAFIDVDGVAPRSAKFTSKSVKKSKYFSEVGLVKNEPASVQDAATYVLMGEPRIKRGFKNQETTYATILVSVTEKPEEYTENVIEETEEEKITGLKSNESAHEFKQMQGEPKTEEKTSEDVTKRKSTTDESSDETKHPNRGEKKVTSDFEIIEGEQLIMKPIGENVISLTTGDKLEFSAVAPLDSRQLKNEKLWWTKDGKPFLDVDGIAPRSAKFVSKSSPKPPSSTEVVLIKKNHATLEDSATYVLMGEPKIKRGFKSQVTTYATIIVAVVDKETEILGETPRESQVVPFTEPMKEEQLISEPPKGKEKEVKPEERGEEELEELPIPEGENKKEKRKKKKSRESEDGDPKKKAKKKKDEEKVSLEEVPKTTFETIELRCIEASANRRLGHDKIRIPAGEPLCLTVTGIPPEVESVDWTLNGQPVRSGKRVQRLLEPNPLGKRYDGELMAQIYLDSTVLLDSGDYELSIKPTKSCPISANLKVPVEIVSARKDRAKRRARMESQRTVDEKEDIDDNLLQVQPNLCQPLGFAANEGQPLSLIADLNVPPEQVPPESVLWSRNGVPLSRDDPAHDFTIKPSDRNHGHTSVILYKPAITLDDVGFYSVTYNPLPAIREEPLAEAADEEGYGVAWEVDFPELLVFPVENMKTSVPSFTKELPEEIHVSEGDTVTLDVEIAEPIPGLTPMWSVNGHDINPSRTSEYVVWHSGNYFALTIPAVGKRHLGDYELRLTSKPEKAPLSTSCRVRGTAEFGTVHFDTPKRTTEADKVSEAVSAVSVVDGIAPMFTKKLNDLDCYCGDDIVLTCRVVGDPIPHIFWRHNGEIVESDDHRRVRSFDNISTLKIFSVKPEDRGIYICNAVNEVGKTQTSANVTVDGLAEPYKEVDTDLDKTRPIRYGVPRIAPDGLVLEKATPTDLTIRWSPVVSSDDGEVAYTVEISKDNGYFWSPVLTDLKTNRATIPYTIASPLQPIQVRVLAENAFGTGPPSQPVLKVPARVSVPNMAAIKPIISDVDLGSVMITWSDPNGSQNSDISYIIEIREGARSEWKSVVSGLKDRSYIYHLKPGVSSMVRIRAYNEFGTSEPSAAVIANLPVEHLIPDLAVDPPWVSVVRPDVGFSEKNAQPGLMLHWKEAYLPEYCDDCVRGLKPIYTLEWRKGRTGPWLVIDDCVADTTSYKLPGYIVKAIQDASNYGSQAPEIRVVCRNDYGSTLPTKSLRLTDFGLPKQSDPDASKTIRAEDFLFSLPIMALPEDKQKHPLWLTSMDIGDGISLKWEEFLLTKSASPHGKYRMECTIMPGNHIPDPEGWWKPVGPRSQPILGNTYCLGLPLNPTAEQRIRLLVLANDNTVSLWLNAYEHVRIPSRRQLLPSAVEGLRARVYQPQEKGGSFYIRLDWSPCGQTEGEMILKEQLESEMYFSPTETSYRVEVQEGHGLWRGVGTVAGSSKTFFEHKAPIGGISLRYRVIPFNRYGEGPETEASAVRIPKRLTELQGCVEDLRALIVAPRSVFLRWRLGDEAIDALGSMGRRNSSSSESPSRGGMGDSGYEENTYWPGAVRYSVERRIAFSTDWYPVATVDSPQDELTGKVTLTNCPKEMYGNEYRVIALLNGQPCAPSRPVRINIKTSELAPDLSYQKVHVDVSKVDEYQISYPEERLEAFFSSHVLASTLPQCVEEDLTFDIEAMRGNSKEWEKIATGLTSPSFAWGDVNPLIPYSFRIVGRNQFGIGLPSRTTHIDSQVVIPDLSFVVPTVREATGILEGREPPELHWQTPRVYSLAQTFTPFTYEVQVRSVGVGSSSDEWTLLKEGLKQPRCPLEGLDPTQEYALRVVAVTSFGRGEPSQQTRKRRSRGGRSSQLMSNHGSMRSSYDSIPPQFENPSPEVVYVPTGGDLDLRCTLASFNLKNPVQFIWSFNFQEIPNLPKHEQFPSGYFQHVTGGGKSAQLRLFDLDERDFGTYACKAINTFGSAIKEFRVVRADAPVITEVPLPIITLPVHHTLLLPCCVDAVPPAKITWTRDSKRLTSSHRTWIGGETSLSEHPYWSVDDSNMELSELTVDASLRVERCVFQDAGLYTMIAENPAGRAHTSCIVRVEETLTPRTITPRWSNVEKHYFVLHKIATGSFSRAHLLIDKKTNREYVGKIYALADPMTRVLGAREFECLNRLHHNNVVEMVDAVVSDDHLVLVTERLSGNHLLEEVLLGHTWTEAAATMLIKELLEAVAHLHEEGIVHLDIQPDNIIFPRGTSSRSAGLEGLMQALNSLSVDTVGAGGRSDLGVVSCFVKLTGFSMAQPIGQRQGLQMASIMPPTLWCPDFAAPEVLKVTNGTGEEEEYSEVCVGFAADVWSIGVIAYLLLFGEHPVIRSVDATLNSDDVLLVEDRLRELAALSAKFHKDVSSEAIDFLQHLLAAEPCNRPTAKECLRHPWLGEGSRSARNLENNLNSLKSYQRIYQKRKMIPTEKWRRESFLRFAGRACIEATPVRRSITPAPPDDLFVKIRSESAQPRCSSVEAGSMDRGYSIDRDLTNRIATLMVPPEERIGGVGSGASSLRSSMLHLDIDDYQINQSPLESPSLRLAPWRGVSGSRSPSLISADDSSEPVKRLCDDISRERDEQILPVEPHLCEGPIKSTNKLVAPIFSNPLRDSRIDPQTNSVFFSCQIANPPRLPVPELLYQRSDIRKSLEALGLEGYDLGGLAGRGSNGGVAAAWYLGGCLLSEAPGVALGASSDGWLWLRLDDAERGMAGKVIECVIRARHGKAKTRARILLPEPPSPPGRPGILQSASTEVLVGWSCGNDDSCEDFIYRVDVKYPDAKPVASAWRTVGYTVDRRFLITDLESDQVYRTRVCVRNAVGWSAYSIASSEFRLHSGQASKVSLIDEEREWMLQWRQAAHPFGLSDHPEAMSSTAVSKAGENEYEAFKRPPPSGIVNEMIQAGGLFPHLEAVKMLCRTEGLISRGAFGSTSQLLVLLRPHPALVERGDIPNHRLDKQLVRLPAFLVARITRFHDAKSGGPLEAIARQQALLLTLLRSTATTSASGGLEGAPLFTQQFGIRIPCLLPQSLCLGWLANDAAKPTAGVGLSTWVPGGALLDVLVARGEFTEFSVARWVHQLLCALRWLHTAFHGRLHGRVDFDNIHAARRSSALPDIVLTGIEPMEPFEKQANCFTAPELDDGGKCNALSDLFSVGVFAYFLLLAESYTTSISDRQASRTPTPTGVSVIADAPEIETSLQRSQKNSVVTLSGGYRQMERPLVNLKAIKPLSKWGRRFVSNVLQVEPMSRGSLDFWLENEWFSLKADVVKQLTSNTIPSKYVRVFRPTENLYGVVPLFSDETDPLSTV